MLLDKGADVDAQRDWYGTVASKSEDASLSSAAQGPQPSNFGHLTAYAPTTRTSSTTEDLSMPFYGQAKITSLLEVPEVQELFENSTKQRNLMEMIEATMLRQVPLDFNDKVAFDDTHIPLMKCQLPDSPSDALNQLALLSGSISRCAQLLYDHKMLYDCFNVIVRNDKRKPVLDVIPVSLSMLLPVDNILNSYAQQVAYSIEYNLRTLIDWLADYLQLSANTTDPPLQVL